MKKWTLSLITLVALVSGVFGVEVTLPATVSLKPGRLAQIKASAPAGAIIKWVNLSADFDLIPSETGKWAIISAPAAGVYRIAAYTSDKDGPSDPAICVVTVGDPPPPVPPVPPVPPAPTDPLTAALQAGYALDMDPDRAKSLAFLQAAYKGMAAQAPTQTALKTNADALGWMKSVIGAPTVGLTPAQLVNTRKAIAADLAAQLGTSPATDLNLDKFTVELNTIAKSLMGVK